MKTVITFDQIENKLITWDDFDTYQWSDFKLVEIIGTGSTTAEAIKLVLGEVDFAGKAIADIDGVKVVSGLSTIRTMSNLEASVYAYNRDVSRAMIDYLPRYYLDFDDVQQMIDAEADELKTLNAEITATLEQMYVDTATYGLSKWETIYDVYTDVNKTVEQRRASIKAKQRSNGTLTLSALKEVAKPFYEIDVVEDYENYGLTVYCISQKGIPPDASEFKEVLRAVIPAHIALTIKFAFTRWNELEANYITFDALALESWDNVETMTI